MPPAPWLAVVALPVCIAAVRLLRLPALTPPGSDRLTAIDGLRGFLAVAVFPHHFSIAAAFKAIGRWLGPRTSTYNPFGTAGVAVFFMNTGFPFFGKIKAARGAIDLNRFSLGNVFRVVPVYAVSVALV